jgi:thioredoxin-like negative regulator of GroEL
LTEDNFKSDVMGSIDMWLVLFVSAQNSGVSIKSEWEQAARELRGKVKMGKVFSKELAQQFGLKSFPTIMYFPKGEKSDQNGNINYQGDIKANSIVSWALWKYNGLEETQIGPMVEPIG